MPKKIDDKKTPAKTHPKTSPGARSKYFEGVGRRKTAIARVRVFSGSGKITINDREARSYFPLESLTKKALSPLNELKLVSKLNVSAKISGGGSNAQSEAFRHGLARALVVFDEGFKKRLRALGFLTRDPRMVERKKYGFKKARRAPQWKKR